LFQDPQLFINKWLQSQTRDLKTMTDVAGNPEEERRVDFYYQPWVTEGVCRYRTVPFSFTGSSKLLAIHVF
jgi:SWI/SNF-related matrix-associated actin-dependent regulator of chromatin subfamily D